MLKRLKYWFIGDLLAKTDDVFERAKIELLYQYNNFFLILGLLFYGMVIVNEIWYHFAMITFGLIAISITPFILKFRQNLKSAADWFVVQQTVTSTGSVCIQEFAADMSGPIWTLQFVLFVIFMFGSRGGILRILPFVSMFFISVFVVTSGKSIDFGFEPADQLPNQPFVSIIPFCLCLYLIVNFVRTNMVAQNQIREQKQKLAFSYRELDQQRREVTASITYAKRIQLAVLPEETALKRQLPEHFIYYLPKDIVSGDFYWCHAVNKDEFILVCADCTGHGVPGAMMTVICSSLLNQVVIENKVEQPAQILQEIDLHINNILKQDIEHENYVRDGMDLSLIRYNQKTKDLIISSAKRPAFLVRNQTATEIKGNKFSLGGMRSGAKQFQETTMKMSAGDMLYLFSDGYHDQFGGPNEKKFSTKRLRKIVSELSSKSIPEQFGDLRNSFHLWKGELEQLDDVLVIGIRFT